MNNVVNLTLQEDINGLNMWQAGGQVHLFVSFSILINVIGILSYLLTVYTLFFVPI